MADERAATYDMAVNYMYRALGDGTTEGQFISFVPAETSERVPRIMRALTPDARDMCHGRVSREVGGFM